MQSITTKYMPATNTKAARVQAKAAASTKYISWDYALGTEDNHLQAAKAYQAALGWPGVPVSGQNADGSYAHLLLHAKHAAPSPSGLGGIAYRPRQVEKVLTDMPDGVLGNLIVSNGINGVTKYLSVSKDEISAILDLLNQIDGQ
jgi:hypothetical protein